MANGLAIQDHRPEVDTELNKEQIAWTCTTLDTCESTSNNSSLSANVTICLYHGIPNQVDDRLPPHFIDPDFNHEPALTLSVPCDANVCSLQSTWTPLPQETFISILSWLQLDSLVRCMRVCRNWDKFIRYTRELWEDISCDNGYIVDQKAIEQYMKRAGQNGIRKISLGSSTAMKLDSRRFINSLLEQGVGKLQYLDMSDWRLPTPDCLRIFNEAKSSLRSLNLSNLPWIEIIWKDAIATLENLEHIEYYNCYPELLPDQELPLRTSLKTLRASGSFGVTNNLIFRLRQFPNLQEVTLNSIRIRNAMSLAGFIMELPNIRKLHIRMLLWPGFEYPSQLGTTSLSTSAMAICDDDLVAVLNGCFKQLAVLENISLSRYIHGCIETGNRVLSTTCASRTTVSSEYG